MCNCNNKNDKLNNFVFYCDEAPKNIVDFSFVCFFYVTSKSLNTPVSLPLIDA